MLPGILGVIMMLPGIPYIFALAFIYAFIGSFTTLSMNELLILSIGLIASLLVDQTAGFFGAYWGGARGKTFLFAIVGSIIGIITLPPLGGIIGLAIGLFVGEIYRRKYHEQYILASIKSTLGGLIGAVAGIAINTIIAMTMIVLFAIFVLI